MGMENFEKEQTPESATDTEVAMFFIQHIEHPCEDLEGNNIRDFYLREAQKALEKMENPHAKQLLSTVIEQYTEKK